MQLVKLQTKQAHEKVNHFHFCSNSGQLYEYEFRPTTIKY